MSVSFDERTEPYDIAVIGGGINGCGIARDAAGRGLSVLLLEQGDLAQATSSASSKLIHGGIRYLEHYEFRLVRESLKERDVVLNIAPHISRPMRFVFPHHPSMRPMWMIRMGLFLYDHLGGKEFPASCRIPDFARSEAGVLLKSEFTKAFEYSDCWIDDARLVVLTARDAMLRGARILTRMKCTRAQSSAGIWSLDARDALTGTDHTFRSRVVVNATGPWVSEFLSEHMEADLVNPERSTTRKVKGSHLIVRKWFAHNRAYILQNSDERIVFVLPFEDDYVLVGTTDDDFDGDPGEVRVTDSERRYLLQCVRDYFTYELPDSDVVGEFAGVRPLYDDGVSKAQEATRDYVLKYARTRDGAGLLNVFGGKLTTYRKLAEAAMGKIEQDIGTLPPRWTATAPLPGGDFSPNNRRELLDSFIERFAFVSPDLMTRWFRSYGLEVESLLKDATSTEDLGAHFGEGLYEIELRWMVDKEWARTVEDILWRRSKLGLRGSNLDMPLLEDWIAHRLNDPEAQLETTRNGSVHEH
jgi:glycerol-3-phosphate dehydrogenase